jgi:hypothetical protein
MAHSRRRESLIEEVRKQVTSRLDGPIGDLKAAQEGLTYLSWLALHCTRFAALPSFLDAARSDVVAILYAGALGLERTAYLHARSLLENLVRHCFYDSRPALFVTRQVEHEDAIKDRWAELLLEIQRLPHFRSVPNDSGEEKTSLQKAPSRRGRPTDGPKAVNSEGGSSLLFGEIEAVYQGSCRFVHGSTVGYRSMYQAIRSISMDADHTQRLGAFLQRLSEACLLLISMYHLGPYLLISQPIRRYMLLQMRTPARARFLRCLEEVPLTWAAHQKSAALVTLRERKRRPVESRDGLLLETNGRVLVANPGP